MMWRDVFWLLVAICGGIAFTATIVVLSGV